MIHSDNLRLYSALSQVQWLKRSYIAKIMLVAFFGTHVPLLALLTSFVASHAYSWAIAVQVLGVALVATLAGTAATLYAIHRLLSPVILTSTALQNYLSTRTLPSLPTQFIDEAGTLMANTSKTLHQLDEVIRYLTHYDDQTGLPNRDLFCDRLQETLSHSQKKQPVIAVMVLGLDQFTRISQSLERETLSVLLRAIPLRITGCLGQSDILAYLGNGEFAIARTEIPSFESVIKLSQLLLATLAKPFPLKDSTVHLTASLGIAMNGLDEQHGGNQLLQQAQVVLSEVKQQRRNHYQFYSPEINEQLQERLVLENDLHQALTRGELLVYYQPLIHLSSRQVIATEALVRWQHPTRGLVAPAAFIPIAEANGLIVPIGEWVLRTACAQNYAWQAAGLPPIRISVNLSAQQFEQPNLVEVVRQILEETQLDARYLELEVTESLLMTDIQRSIQILNQLRDLGLSLALDDFGTGYSSLNYLKQLPVNKLKIDRSFVQDVTSNPDSAAVTDAIIALARSLQLTITAEGVETQEQLEYLQMRGCPEGQGFYFSRPVPADTIAPMLKL